MGLIEFCLKKPMLVAVVVVFVLVAGYWALISIPIQLAPDVDTPKATVRTLWPGASPHEVEREIVSKQEEHLDKLPNLVRISSRAQTGRADVTLEFEIGTDMNAVLPRISNELDQVSSYPENALKPVIILAGAVIATAGADVKAAGVEIQLAEASHRQAAAAHEPEGEKHGMANVTEDDRSANHQQAQRDEQMPWLRGERRQHEPNAHYGGTKRDNPAGSKAIHRAAQQRRD